jgi:hypothetical protein
MCRKRLNAIGSAATRPCQMSSHEHRFTARKLSPGSPRKLPTKKVRPWHLSRLSIQDLWTLWDSHFPRRPKHTNRHHIESRLAYRIQELAYGGLPAGIRDHLADCGAQHSKITIAAKPGRGSEVHLMPGTQLLREWDEREYRVTVTPDGQYELDGQLFQSLSTAARHITGTQWSGPKFFGLLASQGARK